jgi:aspartate aminotransferase
MVARWILRWNHHPRTILRKLQWFCCIWVNVVSVISRLTLVLLPAIADFENLLRQKQKRFLFVIQETQRVICIQRRNDAACWISKKHDLFLIADEVYREFTYDGDVHYSVMKFLTRRKRYNDWLCIKRYSMCGARIALFSKKRS